MTAPSAAPASSGTGGRRARRWRLRELDREALAQSLATSAFDDANLPALEAEEGSLLDEITQESIPEDVDLAQWREERLRNTKSDLPLTLNAQVIRLINYFVEGRGRHLSRHPGPRRRLPRDDRAHPRGRGVPKEMFHLAQAESGFRPKARSYARATGMWQFMAFRGKQYGLRQDRYLEERYDFEKVDARGRAAPQGSPHRVRRLVSLAFAAYNAGPGRVTRAIERGNTRDYWEMCERKLLPRQTREYVPIILAMTYVDKNLDMYDVGTYRLRSEARSTTR